MRTRDDIILRLTTLVLSQFIRTPFGLFIALMLMKSLRFVALVLNGSVFNSNYFQDTKAFNSLGHKNHNCNYKKNYIVL
jgi:hypothetical protein